MTAAVALPDYEHAKLPAAYQAAKMALAQCAKVDECKEWSDRMEALCSYARQSGDETLLKHCMRIKARAIDQCGEILRSMPEARGNNQYTAEDGGDEPTKLGRFQAAAEAGLSRDQTVVALRVNAVPRQLFDELVESDDPPTITKLARLGTAKRPEPVVVDDYLKGRDPADFEQAGALIGVLGEITTHRRPVNLQAARRGLNDREWSEANTRLTEAKAWLQEVEDVVFAR